MASPTPVPICRTTATESDSRRGTPGSDWSGVIDLCGSPGNFRSSHNVCVGSAVPENGGYGMFIDNNEQKELDQES